MGRYLCMPSPHRRFLCRECSSERFVVLLLMSFLSRMFAEIGLQLWSQKLLCFPSSLLFNCIIS